MAAITMATMMAIMAARPLRVRHNRAPAAGSGKAMAAETVAVSVRPPDGSAIGAATVVARRHHAATAAIPAPRHRSGRLHRLRRRPTTVDAAIAVAAIEGSTGFF
jgi:hypothetical protein